MHRSYQTEVIDSACRCRWFEVLTGQCGHANCAHRATKPAHFDHSKARVLHFGDKLLAAEVRADVELLRRSLQIYRLHAVFGAIWIRLDCRRARAARRFERNGVGFNNQNDDGVAAGEIHLEVFSSDGRLRFRVRLGGHEGRSRQFARQRRTAMFQIGQGLAEILQPAVWIGCRINSPLMAKRLLRTCR